MIESFFAKLAELDEVEAIALGGSRAGENFDEKSDYDIYLYCTAPVPVTRREEIYTEYCSYVEMDNHFWEQEDNGTFLNGVDFDVLFRNLDDFTAGVARVVEEGQAGNGYSTCMWHNLRTCRIICDKTGRLTRTKARFDVPYPRQLQENIIRRNWKLLRAALPAYEEQIAKAVARGDLVSVNHRTAAFLESYFDILFALNEQTHPGEKRLMELCKKTCPKLPERFEENLEGLFAHLFAAPERVAEDIRSILNELEMILI